MLCRVVKLPQIERRERCLPWSASGVMVICSETQPRHMEFGAKINITNLHIMYGVQFVSQPLHTRQ